MHEKEYKSRILMLSSIAKKTNNFFTENARNIRKFSKREKNTEIAAVGKFFGRPTPEISDRYYASSLSLSRFKKIRLRLVLKKFVK